MKNAPVASREEQIARNEVLFRAFVKMRRAAVARPTSAASSTSPRMTSGTTGASAKRASSHARQAKKAITKSRRAACIEPPFGLRSTPPGTERIVGGKRPSDPPSKGGVANGIHGPTPGRGVRSGLPAASSRQSASPSPGAISGRATRPLDSHKDVAATAPKGRATSDQPWSDWQASRTEARAPDDGIPRLA